MRHQSRQSSLPHRLAEVGQPRLDQGVGAFFGEVWSGAKLADDLFQGLVQLKIA